MAPRTLEQIKHPFETKMFPELELLDCVVFPQESGFYTRSCDKDGKVDPVKYAHAKANELMGFLRPLLINLLNEDLADKYAEAVISDVQKDPEKWRYDYLNVKLVARKTKSSAH